MSHPTELKRLNEEVSRHMGHLSKSLLYVLCLYIWGMTMVGHCGQTRIASFLAGMLDEKEGTVKQRLRELTYESQAKRGEKRQELAPETCFAPFLGWILSKFEGEQKTLVLAIDATDLQQRFTVLSLSVVLLACAVPVAWRIQKGNSKGSWNTIWLDLLGSVQAAIPQDWQVSILSDAGLYSKKLYEAIQQGGQHPLMRINPKGYFRIKGRRTWQPLAQLVFRGMQSICLEGTCFKNNPLNASLILTWEAAYEKPCLVLTDFLPCQIEQNHYALRYWIEAGFQDFKHDLFHWEQTKMQDCKRAERLWLVMSMSLFWLISLGANAMTLPAWQSLAQTPKRGARLSRPVLGWIALLVKCLKGEALNFPLFDPYPYRLFQQPLNTYP